jgi:hypothetical protein
MRRLSIWFARLYPRAWRERYGQEFQVLLLDVNPGWRNVWDVFEGAIVMQMKRGAVLRIGLFAATGAVLALAASFFVAQTYTSAGLARTSADPAESITRAFNRAALWRLIEGNALYPQQRQGSPAEDVVERMRRNISVTVNRSNIVKVSFSHENPAVAQKITTALLATTGLEVIDPPQLPARPEQPRRAAMTGAGLLGGMLLGCVVIFAQRARRGTA